MRLARRHLAAIALCGMATILSPASVLAQNYGPSDWDTGAVPTVDEDPLPRPFPVDEFSKAHESFLTDDSIQKQFAIPEIKPRKPDPPWLTGLMRFLGDVLDTIAPVLKILFWLVAGLFVLAIVLVILREAIGFKLPFSRRSSGREAVDIGYRPTQEDALALLDDADRLAREGRYDDAVRVLLSRSIADIEKERPGRIQGSLTSREIAGLDALPANARPAFARIAAIVERGVFAGRALTRDHFEDARRAYEDFALPAVWSS